MSSHVDTDCIYMYHLCTHTYSGRIRQISANGTNRGLAAIRIKTPDSVHDIKYPKRASGSEAWQWVGESVSFNGSTDQITLELLVVPDGNQQILQVSGSAFFDDLCVSVTAIQVQGLLKPLFMCFRVTLY